MAPIDAPAASSARPYSGYATASPSARDRDRAISARRPAPAAVRPRASTVSRSSNLDRPETRDMEQSVVRFIRRPGDLTNPRVEMGRWHYIVLHHSGESSGGYASIDRFHREEKHWDECGYHFVIGNGSESGDGEIEVGGRWQKQKHGAHTHPPGHTEYNDEGVGICLVGNFNEAPPTPKQIEACRRLVAYLQARCGVSATGVMTHGDAEGAKTDCPGRYFPYDRLLPRSGFASR
jgi:N-acetylmuramoyl-L-alanine amidase